MKGNERPNGLYATLAGVGAFAWVGVAARWDQPRVGVLVLLYAGCALLQARRWSRARAND